ncbi:MAG: hypothetical protein R3F59_01405 [Myxococcota bacterium]
MALAVDADPRYGRFGLRSECPSCGAHLPVNGPAARVPCPECGEDVAVPERVLQEMLGDFEDAWPRASSAQTRTVGDMTWRWTAEAVAGPRCPACDAALEADGAGALTCSCGATIPREPVPKGLRQRVSTAVQVISGEVDQSREEPPAPVALACPNCGAGLSITSRHHRVSPCDHCGSRVHLPDAVWRALHPPRKVEAWWVRFEGERAAARKVREKLERAAAEQRKAAERSREKAERTEREKERAAAAKAAKAVLDAEAVKQRAWIGVPLVLVAGAFTLAALSSEALAALLVLVGQGRWLRHHLPWGLVDLAQDGTIGLTVGLFLVAWVLGIAGATRLAGSSFLALLPWCGFMVMLSLIPMVGPLFSLVFALQHARGTEPTLAEAQPVPWGGAVPLALLHVGLAPLPYLVFAAMSSTALGAYLP